MFYLQFNSDRKKQSSGKWLFDSCTVLQNLFSVAGALNEKKGYGIIAKATFQWVL